MEVDRRAIMEQHSNRHVLALIIHLECRQVIKHAGHVRLATNKKTTRGFPGIGVPGRREKQPEPGRPGCALPLFRLYIKSAACPGSQGEGCYPPTVTGCDHERPTDPTE
jgi:hypothetical protein